MSDSGKGPLIAICGRPNVGKSTLFNRLVGGRPALVHDSPHLTRDRRYGDLTYDDLPFRVVDTGGLDPDAAKEVLGAGVHRQAQAALGEADVAILVVDARSGTNPLDQEVAAMLRKLPIPVVLAANKVDGPNQDVLTHELYALGMGEVYGISATHGRGVEALMDRVLEVLPAEVLEAAKAEADALEAAEEADAAAKAETANPDRPIRVAFVGKPNAGKSSLLNRLVGAERSLVHDVPGTTTDPVDSEIELGGQRFTLVDTAGIRRRARVDEDREKISISMAVNQIRRADVVVLVVDAGLGVAEQDARLASMVIDAGRGLVIGLNKADLLTSGSATTKLREKADDDFRFAAFAPTVLFSAKVGDGVGNVMKAVAEVCLQHRRRIPTAELNRFFAEVLETHPPPIHHGRTVTIRYLTQGATSPPTFLLFANRRYGLSVSYKRYIVNQLRARYGFSGTPLRLIIKAKSETGRKAKADRDRQRRTRNRTRGGRGGGRGRKR